MRRNYLVIFLLFTLFVTNSYSTDIFWEKSELKYYYVNGTPDITGDQEQLAFEDAFEKWSNVVPFKFIEASTASEADFVIKYMSTSEFSSFVGREVSWIAATTKFGDERGRIIGLNHEYHDFSLQYNPPDNKKDLYYVAIHEMGHILGIEEHLSNSAAMMAGYSGGSKRTLHADDIAAIKAIYAVVKLKNEFKNPDGTISSGGNINAEVNPGDYRDYNTTSLVNNEKSFAFNHNSERRFEARVQNFNNIERKFNNLLTYDGGWKLNSDIVGLEAILNIEVEDGTYRARYKYKAKFDLDAITEFENTIPVENIGSIYQYETGNIEAPNTYTPTSITYNFAGWKDDLLASNPRSITPTENATFEAYFKYPHHSNNTKAFSNNSQRKFIRTDNGNLHSVYESMGYVWYERSTDGGTTWTIANGGKPISNLEAKSPSITNSVNEIAIVYQEKNGNNRKIKLAYFDSWGDLVHDNVVCDESYENYSVDAQTVISWGYNSKIIVLWKSSDTFLQQGLVYKTGSLSYYNLTWKYDYVVKLGDTDAASSNPTVGVRKKQDFPVTFHIAWQNGDTELKYTQIGYINGTTMASSIGTDSPSLGSGYTKNYSPSLVVMDDNLPRLTWIGEKAVYQDDEEEQRKIGSTEGGVTIEKKVILRGRNTTDWNSGFWKYGNDPNSVSMNYNESGSIGGYAFAWSEGSPTITGHKSVANTRINWSPVNVNGAAGKDIHLSNGDALEDMYTMGLDAAALPYELVLSDHLTEDAQSGGQGELKVAANTIQSVGREGLINYNESVFFFEVNDIMLDGEVIEFEPLSDTTNFNDLISLNSYLESLPFEVNNNSQLAYSVKYGVVSEEEQILGEGDFINYKVQLVDNVNNEVLGTYDNVTFNENNLELYDNINYIIETAGIGSRTVKMKLVVDYNVEADPNLATIFCESNLLEKTGAVTLTYDGAGQVTTYDLSQNYPNPFNPSTTIKYQIPNAGNVSLKIYDILGAEVMTLVNTTQAKGSYEVNFDASQLSSGVYIYRIQSNEYAASRKMMLLK